ncbi:MAG: hypothetical protein ABSH06_24855 [Thermodesulfobacteriota bacterium]
MNVPKDEKSIRLLSLWEIMKLFRAIELAMTLRDLGKYRSECQAAIMGVKREPQQASLSSYTAVPPAVIPTPEFVAKIGAFLQQILLLCLKINLINTKQTIAPIARHLRDENSHIDMSSLDADLRNVENAIMQGLFFNK